MSSYTCQCPLTLSPSVLPIVKFSHLRADFIGIQIKWEYRRYLETWGRGERAQSLPACVAAPSKWKRHAPNFTPVGARLSPLFGVCLLSHLFLFASLLFVGLPGNNVQGALRSAIFCFRGRYGHFLSNSMNWKLKPCSNKMIHLGRTFGQINLIPPPQKMNSVYFREKCELVFTVQYLI